MKLTPKQNQLLTAIRSGAQLRHTGWQQIAVQYGPGDSRNYVAREQTLFALRDRGFLKLDKHGVHLV